MPHESRPAASPSPSLDLRGLKPVEARARAFAGMFKVKPGQRVTVLVDSADLEREIMKWITETGHRFLKTLRVEDNGASHAAVELIKMDARR